MGTKCQGTRRAWVKSLLAIFLLVTSPAFAGIDLREDTAGQEVWLPPLVDATDGVTPETGLTISNTDIDLLKPGATTITDKNSGGATHVSGGLYYAVFDATDTDTPGTMRVSVNESGARPVTIEVNILPTAVYDAKYAGGAMAANVTAISGDTTAAGQLAETFDNDGTGGDMDLSSLNVTGTTTYTGNVALANGLSISRTSANGNAVTLTGSGTGEGLKATGGAEGNGAEFNSGIDGGSGITSICSSPTGYAMRIVSGGTHGVFIQGDSANVGPGESSGIYISSGSTNGPGLTVVGSGTGADILADITGNLSGTIGGFSTTALADMFDTDSGKVFSDAVAGSVVKEIADHATTPSLTTTGIANAVLDKLLSDHTTPGSLSAVIADIFEFLDGAPTFAEAMSDHGYTSARADKIDQLAPSLLVSSEIDDEEVAVTQTSFGLTSGPDDDDALNGSLVIISRGTQKAVGVVKDYNGTNKQLTLVADPGIFTFDVDDQVDVIATGMSVPLWLVP